ncbi:MAG: M20 family metallopeptidase [Dehalococcoidia bacterium]
MDSSRRDELKARACAAIDARAEELVALSQRIHAHPEVAYHEEQASGWLCELLGGAGFSVERGYAGLATAFRAAFRASAGAGRPVVGILAEYDALPGIGHGCGHNIIATAGAGAGIGVRAVIDDAGGTVHVIGTPAEEVYGGKVEMARAGAFADLDAAMMVHPGGRDGVIARALACAEVKIEYFGREAHAAAVPEQGINALEAMILAYNGINALRQHIRRTARVHGIIKHGGDAPNIVPAYTSASFMVRAEDDEYLEELKTRVTACFQAGAQATGSRLEMTWNPNQYAAMSTNPPLAEAFRLNFAVVGREVPSPETPRPMGSTDMGNVSKIVPGIHPTIAIAPADVPGHSPGFAEYACSDAGDRAVVEAAKALAMTALDVLTDEALRREMREAFERSRAERPV